MAEREPTETGFGEELKRHRLLREVSLESIAAATKISVRHLQALERGDFDRLPAPVFTRGFIRAYATFLGLDPEEMVNAYISEIGAGAGRVHERGEAENAVSRKPSLRAVVLGIVAAAVAVLIGAGIWRYARRPRPEEPKAPTLPPVALSPNIRPVPPRDAAPAPTPAPGEAPAVPASSGAAAAAPPPPAPVVAAPVVAPLTLVLSTQSDCWTEIFSDDRLLFSGILHGGDARTFEARRSFRLTAGNAGALRLSVNGRPLPPLGRAGEVARDVRLDAAAANELLSRKP